MLKDENKAKAKAAEIADAVKDGAITREEFSTMLRGEERVTMALRELVDDDVPLAGAIFAGRFSNGFGRNNVLDDAVGTLDSMARESIAKRIAEESGGIVENTSGYSVYVRLSEGETSATAEIKFMRVDSYKIDSLRRIQVNVDSIRYGVRDQIFRDSKKGLDFKAIATALKEQLQQRISRDKSYEEKQKQTAEMQEFIADLKSRFDTEGFDVDYSDKYGVEAKLTFTTKDKAAFEALIAKLMPAKKQEAAAA